MLLSTSPISSSDTLKRNTETPSHKRKIFVELQREKKRKMDFKRESSREEEGQAFYETSTGTLQIKGDKQVSCQFLLVYQLSFAPSKIMSFGSSHFYFLATILCAEMQAKQQQ